MAFNSLIKCTLFFLLLCFVCFFTMTNASQPSAVMPPLHYEINDMEIGAQYSNQFGYTLNGKLKKKISNTNAFALEVDKGNNKNRLGLTLATALTPHQFLKVTVERLSENLSFNFTSGLIK